MEVFNYQPNMRQNIIPMMIIIFGTIFSFLFLAPNKSQSQNKALTSQNQAKESISVRVQTVADSQKITETIEFPAIVAGDQEVTIFAKSAGNVAWSNLELGKNVAEGSLIARIDDTGNNLGEGKNDFQSIQIQQAELAVKQAKEALDLAKKNDKLLKTDASESAKDLADLQLKSARLNLKSALDSHEMTAPISGTIVEKLVSVGDSVTPGQALATITKLDKIKFKFYVDETELAGLKVNLPIKIKDSQSVVLAGRISNISPQADSATRRFLIEAVLDKKNDPRVGTISTVIIESASRSVGAGLIILPLSAITVGQNENYIFIVQDGKAKKVSVAVDKISGETAEISAQNFTPETRIIISGNKLLEDGDPIDVK